MYSCLHTFPNKGRTPVRKHFRRETKDWKINFSSAVRWCADLAGTGRLSVQTERLCAIGFSGTVKVLAVKTQFYDQLERGRAGVFLRWAVLQIHIEGNFTFLLFLFHVRHFVGVRISINLPIRRPTRSRAKVFLSGVNYWAKLLQCSCSGFKWNQRIFLYNLIVLLAELDDRFFYRTVMT